MLFTKLLLHFPNVSSCPPVNKGVYIRDIAQETSHLFVFDMLLSDLAPFYSKDSSNSSVKKDCELAEVVLSKIPRFASPKECVNGASNTNLRFNPFVDVFVVEEVLRCSHEGFNILDSGVDLKVFV